MAPTILVPATEHPGYAETVADAVLDTEVDGFTAVVLYVFDREERDSTAANLDVDGGRLDGDELAARKKVVNAVRARFESAGVDCRTRGVVTDDDEADAVLRAVEDVDADRVYMFSRRRSPAGKAVFGSTLQRVILNAPVPVVVVPSPMARRGD